MTKKEMIKSLRQMRDQVGEMAIELEDCPVEQPREVVDKLNEAWKALLKATIAVREGVV